MGDLYTSYGTIALNSKSIDDMAGFFAGSGQQGEPSGTTVVASGQRGRSMSHEDKYRLSAALNKCITLIASNVARARVRCFLGEEEINGGPLYNLTRRPMPGMSWKRYVEELVQWYLLRGMMASRYTPAIGRRPTDNDAGMLMPLAVYMLQPYKPVDPMGRDEVSEWQYFRRYRTEEFKDSELLFERNVNLTADVWWGQPTAETIGVQAESGIAARTYNRDYFRNGTAASLHVDIGKAGKVTRDAYARMFNSEYGVYSGNAHKVFVTSGNDREIKLTKLSQELEASFLELNRQSDEDIYRFYNVHSLFAGTSQNSRFDTAGVEVQLFLDQTITPLIEAVTEMLQRDLVDRYFQGIAHSVTRPRGELRKSYVDHMEKAQPMGRQITVMLDPDTMPLMSTVQAMQTEQMEKFRKTFFVTPGAAARRFGVEIEHNEVQDEVWAEGNTICLSNPALNSQLVPGTKPTGPDAEKPAEQEKPDGKKPEPKAMPSAQWKTLKHKLRRTLLKAIKEQRSPSLADLRASVDEEHDYFACKAFRETSRIVRQGGDADAVTAWLNDWSI